MPLVHRTFLDTWANAGHYVFSKEIVVKYFPEEGDFEHNAMQQIAKDNYLKELKYDEEWLILNTMKDLIRIRECFAANIKK